MMEGGLLSLRAVFLVGREGPVLGLSGVQAGMYS